MKIIFMGTPEFAVPSLKILLKSEHEIIAVVTAPDKPRGRGQIVSVTPVKNIALDAGIPLLQPDNMRDQKFINELTDFGADLYVVVAFKILPKEVFTIPRCGVFNLHASLLPKYRGAAPINWALINGEKETGVTTFFIQEKVDTGNIFLQRSVPISDSMNAGELHDILAEIGSKAVLDTVNLIAEGKAIPIMQDDTIATSAPKIFREMCKIDWNKPAIEAHNFVRGLSPYPTAWTTHDEKLIKIYRSKVTDLSQDVSPGTITEAKNRLVVACGDGSLEILEIQQEGRKLLTAEEFLRGYCIHPGDVFN